MGTRTPMVMLVFIFLLLLALPRPGASLSWEKFTEEVKKIQAGAEGRLRYEWWGGLEPSAAGEGDYDFYSLRVRPYLRYPGSDLTFFFQFQYAGGFDLPDKGLSGPGAGYFALSTPDNNPQDADVLEFYMEARGLPVEGLGFRVGRQGIREGVEVLHKQPAFDWLKKARLSERLVGTWDWPNVGRRFDAAYVYYDRAPYFLDGYASKVLAGGTEYGGAMSPLDDVDVLGGSLTLKKDVLLKGTEIRVFEIFYHDDREVTRGIAGGSLDIHTAGASLVGLYPAPGRGLADLLLWGCYQWGGWGRADQAAYAALAEVGYQLPEATGKPWIRAGVAHGSGDNDPATGVHKTFFNLVPTNHKYYGYMDTAALSNLLNVYLQFLVRQAEKLSVQVDGHFFWLSGEKDSWYTGSGVPAQRSFGYAGGYAFSTGRAARLAGGKRFVGSELDLTGTYALSEHVEAQAGYSHFFGAEAAAAVFPEKDDADWFFLQTSVRF